MAPAITACPLCTEAGGEPVWRGDRLRVVIADEPEHPAFVRVIWNAHVAELGDLPVADRNLLMDVVCRAERALREVARPDKINLASLGNRVPHLHWHVIARWADDSHFPDPVWASPRRAADPAALARREAARALRPALGERLRALLDGAGAGR